MTPRERLLAVLDGETPDRVPVYTQIPFAVTEGGFVPGPFHGYDDCDGWRARDPRYRSLVARMEEECDNFFIWRPPCMVWDQFFVPPGRVERKVSEDPSGRIVTRFSAAHGGRTWSRTQAVKPGTGHAWELEHFCKSPEDASKLLDMPWEGHPALAGDFSALEALLGDRGVMWVTIPSPLLVVCRLFDPNDFLVFVRTEEGLIGELMGEASRRIAENLSSLLEQGVGPVVRFGGAEHATPPLMSPGDFDRLVVEYDALLVSMCKEAGRKVAYHCHGRIRHALARFAEMGVDQTDPVETVPDGDVSLEEARRISNGRVTLMGNIQMREIASADPGYIASRVRRIIEEAGPQRLVVTTTGTPLEALDERSERNYHAMIDAVLAFGKL
jgi:uroporphyrinogen-III decarboxylase